MYRNYFRQSNTLDNAESHFLIINLIVAVGMTLLTTFAGGITTILGQYFWIILTFLFCNIVEWYEHRYVLHIIPTPTRHLVHHQFFTDRNMFYDSFQDSKLIFFELADIIWFLVMATIGVIPLGFRYGSITAYAVLWTVLGYYGCYEWLHLAYHSPPSSILGRLPFIATLRKHHQLHHNRMFMRKHNFNITIPFGDWLFDTLYR